MALFEALSRPGRLAVFRAVLQAGPEGTTPAELVRRLGTTGSALTFHLRALSEVGLVRAAVTPGRWSDGPRPVVLTASLDALDALSAQLHDEVERTAALRQDSQGV
jgi:DNA-binding transcriptional ArsR family regulator